MYLYQKSLLFLAIILPFSFALSPTKNIDLNILKILIPLFFLFWLANSFIKKQLLIDNRLRFWLFLSFLFLCFLSLFWSPSPSGGFRKILLLFSLAPLYLTFYQAQKTKKQFVFTFYKLLILSATILALFGIIQFLSQFIFGLNTTLDILRNYFSPFFLGHSLSTLVNQYSSWLVNVSGNTLLRAFGTFPDPHLFSLYLSMILPFNVYFFKKTSQKKYLLSGLIIFLAIIFSFSRAAYLALIISSIFFFLTSNPLQKIKKYPLLTYSLVTIFIFFLILPNPLYSRLFSSFNLSEGSNSGRIEMWQTAWKITTKHPLTGLGIDGFSTQIDSSISYRNPIYAHNLFLDFGAETGIINMFIILLLVLTPLGVFLNSLFFQKNIPQNKNDTTLLFQQTIATSALIFIIHSLFETPFFSVRVFPLFLIILATEANLFKTKN